MSFQKKGQILCGGCEKWINNNAKPEFCECGEYIGGSFTPKEPKLTTLKISDTVFSVIKNKSGPTKRIFVDVQKRFCESDKCLQKRQVHFNSDKTAESFSCEHLEECRRYINPHTTTLDLTKVKEIVTPDCLNTLSSYATNNEIQVRDFDNFVIIDSFSEITRQLPTKFCHVKDKKCTLQACKSKSRIHTLAVNQTKMCLHELVTYLANPPVSLKPAKQHIKIDYHESVKNVLNDVIENFPKLHEVDRCREFLKMEKKNLNMIRNIGSSDELMKNCKFCSKCGSKSEEFSPNRKTDSYLLTLGGMEIVNIPAFVCEECNIITYPKLCSIGYVVVHNKLVISFAFLSDIYNLLSIGGPVVAYLENKLTLLAGANTSGREIKLDTPKNLAVRIEKFVIAVKSAMISAESLNAVMCLICGSFPKIVSTDGEVKDSTEITEDMVFEKTDEPPPSLQAFLQKLQVHVIAISFFQNVPPLRINMLKLPHIMAPNLLGIQQNTEQNKRSQFTTVDTIKVDLHKLTRDVVSGKLQIDKLATYSNDEIFAFAKTYDIEWQGKSGTVVRGMLRTSYERILTGESNCHQYTISQKRTGGWQDAWCEHHFKIGAMVMSRQEGVSNSVDLIQSMKRMPVLLNNDDPCTHVSHLFLTKPEIASVAFGDRKGGFVVPRDGIKADTLEIPDVPAILPLKFGNKGFDKTAITDGGTRHPDTGSEDRFVTGHRLQLKSHKKISCSYHVLDLVPSGFMVNSLDQEGLNVKRKYGRVQQDRHRNFSVCFLFNYLLDFDHNFTKFNEQKKTIGTFKRDDLSWRAIT